MSNAPQALPQVPWPELPTAAWRDTYATLHLWTQVIGKIRLVRSPWLNHSWHVAVHWDGAKDEDTVLLIMGEGPATSTDAEEK